MAKDSALTLSIRIAGKMDSSLTSALAGTSKGLTGLTNTLGKIGTAGVAAITALATATVGVLKKCTDEAANFANSMGNVTKYVAGLADETGEVSDKVAYNGKTYKQNYEETKDELLYLATQIPYTPEDLTTLAAAGGQSGWSREQMIDQGYLRDAAMWGAAMDIDAQTAGDYAAKWEHAFGFDHEQVMDLADVINYLGAKNPTTAAEIANVVNRSASVGQLAGMDPKATAALGTIMLGSGVNEARTATSINRIYSNFMAGDSASLAMARGWEALKLDPVDIAKGMVEDATGTLSMVFGKIANLPQYQQASVIKDIIGQWAFEGGAKFANNMGQWSEILAAVNNPDEYKGSMEREFRIKNQTPEAAKMMYDAAWQQLQVHVGDTFLPAQTKMTLGMRDILVDVDKAIKDMPELEQLSDDLATLATEGMRALADAVTDALPDIQKGIRYLIENGPQIANTIKNVFLAFLGMKFAPTIYGAASGVAGAVGGIGGLIGSAVLGRPTGGKGRTGGLAGLFKGGQAAAATVAATAGTTLQAASIGAGMANSQVLTGAVPTGKAGGLSNSILGAIIGVQSAGTLLNTKGSDRKYMKGFAGVADKVREAKESGGLRGFLGRAAANTAPGRYFGGIRNSVKNLGQTTIGGTIVNGVKATGRTIGEIGSNILGPQGIDVKGSAKGLLNIVKTTGQVLIPSSLLTGIQGMGSGLRDVIVEDAGRLGAFGGKVAGGARAIGGKVAGGAKAAAQFLGAGAGVIGSAWGPAAGMFGSLLTGAAPVVAAIGGVIAIVSILGKHLNGIQDLVEKIFGEKGVKVFKKFTDKLQEVGDFMKNLFKDGGLKAATSGIREQLVGMLGDNPNMESYIGAFDGVITIGQSILGVIQQLVDFGTGVVRPIIEQIFEFITQTVLPTILDIFSANAPAIAGILSGLGSAIMGCMTLIGQAIQAALPFVMSIVEAIMQIGSVVIPLALGAFDQFVQGINTIIEAVKTIFDGLIQFLTGVFTGNWSKAWEGVKQIFKGVFDSLVGLVKTPLNAVISVINGVLNRINGINFTIPDWVPVLGGHSFGLNIPKVPMLAQGGFTTGPSIAGEAGREAVISFQRGVRTENVETWVKAGRLLGVSNQEAIAATTGNTLSREMPVRTLSTGNGEGGAGTVVGNQQVSYTYSPNITIQGNADREVIESALRDSERRWEQWLKERERNTQRRRY